MTFSATKHPVANRGVPPDSFLYLLVDVGMSLPAPVTSPNNEQGDVFNTIHFDGDGSPILGPWQGQPGTPERALHRLAVMLEILRVLAGFESSWQWNEGRDISNPAEDSLETISAGPWQISYNSRAFGPDLGRLIETYGIHNGTEFQARMKDRPPFAIEYTARLLRHTTRHNGPVKRREIHPWLRRDAVEEFKTLLSPQAK